MNNMKLVNGSKVAIIGGGPAGTLTAIFMLDLAQKLGINLHVDIYEPNHFSSTGPKGCNMCGGVISESLVQLLAVEGIHLPDNVVIDTINAYILHTDNDSVRIETPQKEMRIATIFRGGGPKGAENQQPLPWTSFDLFLLQLAIKKGARHLPYAVTGLQRKTGLPTISSKKQPEQSYDFLVGAVGINHTKSLELFKSLEFGYIPPKTTKAYITELYYGEKDVAKYLGSSMHVFLLNITRLKFAAITPKGHYATVVLLGDKIDHHLVEQFFHSPEVQKCLPPGWEIPVQPCHCQPWINIGTPKKPYADRIVLVGDASVSRLYKDGIGAAYRMAKRCALTALTHGVAEQSLHRYYWLDCEHMMMDNLLGHGLFAIDGLLRRFTLFRQGLMAVLKDELCVEGSHCPLCSAFWNTFTGSASYIQIGKNMFHPKVMLKLLLATGQQWIKNVHQKGRK